MRRNADILFRGGGCMESKINSSQMEFIVFCIENLAEDIGINGNEAYCLLAEKSDVLYSYIAANSEVLHTQSKEYIIEDIKEVMRKRGVLQ